MVDLTDATDGNDDDSGTILVPKVEGEDIPTEEVNEEDKNAKSAQYGIGHPQYGRGMRTRTKPVLYEPVMTVRHTSEELTICATEGPGTRSVRLCPLVTRHIKWVS